MNVVLWWSGASVSIVDVCAGLAAGLEANGVKVWHYRTDAEIEAAGHTLKKLWMKTGRTKAERIEMYSPGDVIYRANARVLELASRVRRCHGGVDWIVCVSGMYQHPNYLLYLRDAGFKIALLCTESPYDMAAELALAEHADVVFTNERACVPTFQTVNEQSYYLAHAWHPVIHAAAALVPADTPAHDVVFVGTGFQERIDLLAGVDWAAVGDLGLYGIWSLVPPRAALRKHMTGGPQTNAQTAALYRAAKAGLNLHRTSVRYGRRSPHVQHAESMNPRCYELAATGCFFVTDARAEVAEVFGDSVPTFSTPAECQALLERAMRDEAWRMACAAQARQRVQWHSWTQRAAHVVEVLQQHSAALVAA